VALYTVLLFIPGACSSFADLLLAMAVICYLSPSYILATVPLALISHPSSGNPGLLNFYVPFLNTIHHKTISKSTDSDLDSGPSSSVTIFTHAHLGLSSYISINGGGTFTFPKMSSVMLLAQIQAHIKFFDEILATYGPAMCVLLIRHSIGAWFIQEVLKAHASLHPQVRAYMLFPTLSNITKTLGGRMLWVCDCMCCFNFDLASNALTCPCGASLHSTLHPPQPFLPWC
jgi:hypothetical protein